MQEIIQESRYEQARESIKTRRSVKWKDDGEHELPGGATANEEDKGSPSASPRRQEKTGAIQQEKRQHEQLKLDQRQMHMFQGTHFQMEKPRVPNAQEETGI